MRMSGGMSSTCTAEPRLCRAIQLRKDSWRAGRQVFCTKKAGFCPSKIYSSSAGEHFGSQIALELMTNTAAKAVTQRQHPRESPGC